MKAFLLIFCTGILVVSAKGESKTYVYAADTMVCESCVKTLEAEIAKIKAVESIQVSLEKKQVTVTFKDGKPLSPDQIDRLFREGGYPLKLKSTR